MRQRTNYICRDGHKLLTVDQGITNGWAISFNPDDDMFYVHAPDENQTTVRVYNMLRNARQWAKHHDTADWKALINV